MGFATTKAIHIQQHYYLFCIPNGTMAGFEKTKIKSPRARSRAGNSGLPLHSHRIPMGGLLIGYECGAKNRLVRSRGFRGISSTIEKMIVCGIPRPLDRAGVVAPFLSPTQTLIPLVYDAPASGASYALHSGVVAASRQFKSF